MWKFRVLGRVFWLRQIVKYLFGLMFYEGRVTKILFGPLRGVRGVCSRAHQFWMPLGLYENETAENPLGFASNELEENLKRTASIDYANDKLLESYNAILDKYVKKLPKIVSEISKIKINSSKIKKTSYNKTINEFNKRKNILKKHLSNEQINKGLDILRKNKPVINKSKLVLTHGDLHPGNIILNKNNRLVIIDWFNAHLNNMAFDSCFVWFSLWGYPEEQDSFLEKILEINSKEKQFKKLFSLNQIILTPKFLEIMSNIKKETNPESDEYEDIIEAEEFFVKTYKEVLQNYEK